MEEKDNFEKLKENYEKVKKKYKLPTFEEMDDEFEIRKIDYDSILIREIRRAISNKLIYFSDMLDPILNPHESLRSTIESNFFNEEDIKDMAIFYKRIWHLLHISANTSLSSEADEVKFINDIWLEWPKLKKKAKHFSDKLIESWAQAEKEDTPLHYTG
ncbi:MAG: hypothetical protein AABW84_01305 [Nanoarchaeota archaeon]